MASGHRHSSCILNSGTTHLSRRRPVPETGRRRCLFVPGTIFNGHHHERLRRHEFLTSKRPVALEISEVWQVAPGTFKYPGAAIIGHKRAKTAGLAAKPIAGFLAEPSGLIAADFSVQTLGSQRTAWVLAKEGMPVAAGGMCRLPQQGADLMPGRPCASRSKMRPAPNTRSTRASASPRFFAVKAAKELKASGSPVTSPLATSTAWQQSENLLPFTLGAHCAPIAIPAERDASGAWLICDEADIRRWDTPTRPAGSDGSTPSSPRSARASRSKAASTNAAIEQATFRWEWIHHPGWGRRQAYLRRLPAGRGSPRLVIDQTLYWKVFGNEDGPGAATEC